MRRVRATLAQYDLYRAPSAHTMTPLFSNLSSLHRESLKRLKIMRNIRDSAGLEVKVASTLDDGFVTDVDLRAASEHHGTGRPHYLFRLKLQLGNIFSFSQHFLSLAGKFRVCHVLCRASAFYNIGTKGHTVS